jgi:PST family polysaccharide transporter
LTSPIVSTAGSYFFAPYLPRFRLSEWRAFSGFMGWITLNQLFSALLWQFDKLVLGRFVSARTLGGFYVAGNLSTLPFQVIGTPILRPFAAALAISHGRNRLVGAYQKATRGVCLIMAPIIIALALLAHPIVILLLGAKWEGASQWLAFLALASLPALPMQTLPSLCIALNRAGSIAARSGVEFALYLPMVTLGYFWLGIAGVIGAKFLSLVVSAIFSLFLVRALLNLSIREQLQNLAEPAIAALAMGLVMRVPLVTIPEPRDRIALIAYTLGVGGFGMIAYGLVAVGLWNATGRRDGAERVVVHTLKKLGQRAKFIEAWRRS